MEMQLFDALLQKSSFKIQIDLFPFDFCDKTPKSTTLD